LTELQRHILSSFSLAAHFDRPLIFAHRGANTNAPENTLAAFELARQEGADGIELDVKLTGDGQVVILHDQTVDRTTDGHGLLRSFSLPELKKLDAGSWFDRAYAGEPIPTLADVFKKFGSSILYDIELTNYAAPLDDLPRKVAQLIQQFRLSQNVLVTSFLPIALAGFQRVIPTVPAGLIALRGLPGSLSRSALGRWLVPQAVIPYYTDLTPHYIQAQARMKRSVIPWTVNEPEAFRRMFDWGVGAIITDVPAIARRALEVV
jgi:glycerophosphoryl diester phosphodiesterase